MNGSTQFENKLEGTQGTIIELVCLGTRKNGKGPAFFSYSDNYLIDTDHGVILDVEGTRSIRQAEVGSTQTMLTRVKAKFGLVPDWMIADTAYGSGPMLGWLVERKIDPYIPVIDKAGRPDGTWTRTDFDWDAQVVEFAQILSSA